MKSSQPKSSKRVNSANGYFIGVATKFLKNFNKSENEIITKLFENMDLPTTDDLRKHLNHNSLRAMLASGLDFEVNELVNDDVNYDFETVKEAQLKYPQWDDVFEKLIKEKFPSSKN